MWDKSAHSLMFPGNDSLIPGVLTETILAMEYIDKKKLPGSDFKLFLRTNLSSFWRFDMLMKMLSQFQKRKTGLM